jgi:hypothetical protein
MRRISVLVLAVLFGGTAICTAQQQRKLEIFGGFSLQRPFGYPNVFNVNVNQTTPADEFTGFNMTGGEVEVTYFPFAHVGFTGDIATAGKSQNVLSAPDTLAIRETGYVFGPTFRYTFKGAPRLSLFAHQLFGTGHTSATFTPSTSDCHLGGSTTPTCSANPFTLVSGGGVDFKVTSHISVRPAQLDFWEQQISLTKFFGSGLFSTTDSSKLGVDGLRYSAGAVINF